jgi:hypothetical protein
MALLYLMKKKKGHNDPNFVWKKSKKNFRLCRNCEQHTISDTKETVTGILLGYLMACFNCGNYSVEREGKAITCDGIAST